LLRTVYELKREEIGGKGKCSIFYFNRQQEGSKEKDKLGRDLPLNWEGEEYTASSRRKRGYVSSQYQFESLHPKKWERRRSFHTFRGGKESILQITCARGKGHSNEKCHVATKKKCSTRSGEIGVGTSEKERSNYTS